MPAHSTLMTENSAAPTNRKRQSIGRTTLYSKRKGVIAELIFVVKAASMGFAVSKPYGDSEPYDVIIEANGRLLRIQVKSVFTTSRWGYSIAVTRKRQQKPGLPYSALEIDFIAAYVVAHDAWYIIPVAEIVNLTNIRLYPAGAKRQDGAHFEKYREAWDLLRRGAARPAEPGPELKAKP
jgi:PD-(D/E)XK endonuclease